MKKSLYITIIAVLAAAFLASAVYLGTYFYKSKQASDRYKELAAMAATEATEPTAPAETQPDETTAPTKPRNTEILPEYKALYEQNNDMVGWLKIEGTHVDYPVLQSTVENANFYLNHNFDKKSYGGGAIYAKEECDVFAPSDNITMFGHNMLDGSMFRDLANYRDEKYYNENKLITFNTIYEYHTYKIFAVFKTTATMGEGFTYQKTVDAADIYAFNAFVNKCRELSFYDTGVIPAYGDKIICLSTCEYTLENGRLVVAAVQIT